MLNILEKLFWYKAKLTESVRKGQEIETPHQMSTKFNRKINVFQSYCTHYENFYSTLSTVHIGRARRFSSEAGTKPDELTIESVRSEINKTLNSLTSRSFCSPKGQMCVQGPPGMRGPKGSRGSKGEPGPHGKQGIIGPQGQKGDQGIQGVPGPSGIPGAKGEPEQCIHSPTVMISPMKQTVKENQTAVFQCSVSGNPKPLVTWFKLNSSAWTDRFRYGPDGRLEMRHVTLEDAGKFICVARNILGSVNQSATLIVEGKMLVLTLSRPGGVSGKCSR